MADTQSGEQQIRDAICARVRKAASSGRALHTGKLAEELSAAHPDCGMAIRDIEEEIVRQVGESGGAAEIDSPPAEKRAR